MRNYDLTPFYRSTVGFDRFFNLLDQVTADGSPGYPPYNIERTGENAYRISVAVSGFSQGELSIVATAKPRSRRSRTVSKYFSIISLRPLKTQTVPLRPAGGAQRAKRSSAPSGVVMVPVTTSSGTGLAGMETSVMGPDRLGEICRDSRGGAPKRVLMRPS